VVVESLHPNQPGEVHDVETLVGEVVVAVRGTVLLVTEEVVSSLHPNHPGVWHEEVDVVVVVVVVGVAPEVVVVSSSRHPHHPGVLQVDVRVCILVVDVFDDVVRVLFPETSFHNWQS
jgi:hypothetical protein